MSIARIRWVSGPVLRARAEGPFHLREAVQVGANALLGEVIRLNGDEILVQVYEDTTGLRLGAQVAGTGAPLNVRLGPGLLGNIFDGLLRPLAHAASPYIQPGLRTAQPGVFAFAPLLQAGMRVASGQAFGKVAPEHGRSQLCLVPPGIDGEVIGIAAAGRYPEHRPLCTLRGSDGNDREFAMSHAWPVRVPRPVAARLPAQELLHTGQRIIDSMFPLARGGKAAIPGGFGTGKTILLESLARWCDADIIVYVGCGERGNEIAGVLEEFPQLMDPRSGRALMERTVIIANTSNMPVSAREASIYTAITVAEYFRDQGLHVALMADSISRWAEALREISGRLGELPGEGGFPAYLSSRLAEFFERAARVRTLAGTEGSVTVMAAVSPPSGDFSEPVVSHSRRFVRNFWALDTRRAQARFYPAINPLVSYSEDAPELAHWWHQQGNTRWSELRQRFLLLIEQQAKLERMARIIGKDALPMRQQLTLLCAELVNEAFLRQSAFSAVDHFASPQRQTAMMRVLGRFIELAEQAVAQGHPPESLTRLDIFRKLQRMGEDIAEGQPDLFRQLAEDLEQAFARMQASHET